MSFYRTISSVESGLSAVAGALDRASSCLKAGQPERACTELTNALVNAAMAWADARDIACDFNQGHASFAAQVHHWPEGWRITWGHYGSEFVFLENSDAVTFEEQLRRTQQLLLPVASLCMQIASQCAVSAGGRDDHRPE